MQHLSNYELFQLERYGNILPEREIWFGYNDPNDAHDALSNEQ